VAFSLIPVIMYQGLQAICGWISENQYSMYAFYGKWCIFFNYVLISFGFFPKLGI
jgi:hypothetical protein